MTELENAREELIASFQRNAVRAGHCDAPGRKELKGPIDWGTPGRRVCAPAALWRAGLAAGQPSFSPWLH